MNQIAPPAPRPFPEHRRAARKHELQRAVARPTRPAWRRRTVLLSAGIALVATTAAGSATYIALAPANDQSRARCFATAALGGDNQPVQEVAIANSNPGSSEPVKVTDPIEQCAVLWRSGVIGNRVGPDELATDLQVPQLVACVLINGTAGVFPGPVGTCQRLGLPTLTGPS